MQEPIVLKQSLWVALLAGAQYVAPPLIVVGVLRLSMAFFGLPFDSSYLSLAVIAGALSLVLLKLTAEGTARPTAGGQGLASSVLPGWVLLVAILLLLGYLTKSSDIYSRRVMSLWFIATPLVLLAAKSLMRWGFSRFVSMQGVRRGVVAGFNDVSQSLVQRLKANPQLGIDVIGYFDDRSAERLNMAHDERLIGGLPDLAQYAKSHGIQVIFVALPIRHVQRVLDLLDDLKDTTTSIYYVPDIFLSDLIQARSGELAGIPVIAMCETPFFGYRGVVKRLTDVVLSLVMLVPLAPVLVLVALLVKLSSPGPAIFRQRRYGLDGEEIVVYKFRTMTVTEDGDTIVQAKLGDQRITPIGAFLRRYSIDELPQIVNVIQGRMSLVGPRPHAVAHNEQYRKLIKGYMVRHKVLPGITGLAQVSGCRGETAKIEEMQARVEFDLEYLRHWSIAMDLRILFKTAMMLVRDKKAY
jgi:putative colanic acid biosynthesis UDP-glucose lipid carrier transferase